MVEHFQKWVPYVQKHGLIIIEAHNVDPRVACLYNGKTHATAFDTYHGYSNQYPLDFEAFMCLAEEAGLRSISYQQCLYPSRLPFVAISINRFKSTDLPSFTPKLIASNTKNKEWMPSGLEDLQDGEALHHFLYENGDLSRPKSWCFRATGMLVETVLKQIEQQILRIKTQKNARRSITLADYGAGTGLASLELIKGLNEKGLLKQIEECGINFQLLLFDFPSAWFAKGYQLLNQFSFVKFYSLADLETGNIRLVSNIIGDQKVDIIIASMVFHLVPPKALSVLFESLETILHNDGYLIWNSPDTSPTMAYSEVIHASNRLLRESFLAYLDKPESLKLLLSKMPDCDQQNYADLPQQLETIKNQLDVPSRLEAQRRADKQILPTPTNLKTIEQALANRFKGKNSIAMSVLRDQDLLDLALLPANQRYINEVDDQACREKLIHLILKYDVIPKLKKSPVGHPSGINLHWTFGQYTKR